MTSQILHAALDGAVVSLRPAVATDQPLIRRLVRRAQINPLGLHWSHFTIAANAGSEAIGIGQLKRHRDGTVELASLVVREKWRGRGIARAIVENLVGAEHRDLYLTCVPTLKTFYDRFGFVHLRGDEIPSRYFRRIDRLARVIRRMSRSGRYPIVMYRSK